MTPFIPMAKRISMPSTTPVAYLFLIRKLTQPRLFHNDVPTMGFLVFERTPGELALRKRANATLLGENRPLSFFYEYTKTGHL